LKSKDKDFYSDIKSGAIQIYQRYFNRMLQSVDVDNLTERSYNRTYDKDSVKTDYDKISKILDEAEKDNLDSNYLIVIFEQYIFADVWKRKRYQENWVERVMKREPTDFFPDPWAIVDIIQGGKDSE